VSLSFARARESVRGCRRAGSCALAAHRPETLSTLPVGPLKKRGRKGSPPRDLSEPTDERARYPHLQAEHLLPSDLPAGVELSRAGADVVDLAAHRVGVGIAVGSDAEHAGGLK
jgi:hypothetical protein